MKRGSIAAIFYLVKLHFLGWVDLFFWLVLEKSFFLPSLVIVFSFNVPEIRWACWICEVLRLIMKVLDLCTIWLSWYVIIKRERKARAAEQKASARHGCWQAKKWCHVSLMKANTRGCQDSFEAINQIKGHKQRYTMNSLKKRWKWGVTQH